MSLFSKRSELLKPSPTLALANKARELKEAGHDVISLTVGEPDWPSFQVACDAGIEAIRSGFTKYTAAHGIPELRAEIAKQTSDDLGLSYTAGQVIVAPGAKFVIYGLLQMILNEGDEVIIPSPYWVSYPTMAEMAGGRPVIVTCEEQEKFLMTPEQLEKAITPKTKALILCSPSNPTGLLYTAEQLKALATVLKKHPHIWVLSDDIYNKLVFPNASLKKNSHGFLMAPHLLQVAPELRDQVVCINGASKTYSMTGWRAGWALGQDKLMKLMADYLSQTTSNLSSPTQKAVLAALQKGDAELASSIDKLTVKKDWYKSQLESLKKISFVAPEGAFYFWMNFKKCLGQSVEFKGAERKLLSTKDIAEVLLEKYFLALVPGEEFGAPGFARISYAATQSDLQKSVDRLLAFERELQ